MSNLLIVLLRCACVSVFVCLFTSVGFTCLSVCLWRTGWKIRLNLKPLSLFYFILKLIEGSGCWEGKGTDNKIHGDYVTPSLKPKSPSRQDQQTWLTDSLISLLARVTHVCTNRPLAYRSLSAISWSCPMMLWHFTLTRSLLPDRQPEILVNFAMFLL